MAYQRIIKLKKKRKNSKVPVNTEWEEFKAYLMRKKRLLQWDLSDWDSNGCAEITVVVDEKRTWFDLKEKSSYLHSKDPEGMWHTNVDVLNSEEE